MGTDRSTAGATQVTDRRRRHRLRSLGWLVRVGAAFGLVVACGLIAPEAVAWVGFSAAFGWAPLAGAVEVARRRRDDLRAAAAAAALDSAGVGLTVLAAPVLAPIAVWVPFLLVALYAQRDRRLGAAMVVVGFVLAGVAQAQVPLPGPGGAPVLLFGAVLIGLLVLHRGWDRSHTEASSALSLAHGRAEAVLTHIADAVVVTGAGGRVQRLNPAAERTLGCPADVAVGARCHEVFELRRGGAALDCTAGCALLDTDDPADGGIEVTRTSSTGAHQPLLATAQALRGADGQAVEVVHSFRDITELKRAQEAQSMFLATATHELKTPLTLILGFAETLASQPDLDDDQREVAITTIHRRAQELDRIVEQVLLSSRIGAGRLELALTDGPVTPVVEECVGALAAVADHPLHLEVAPELPPAQHEPQALVTVLEHLIDNACKYSPDGGPVEVVVSADDAHVTVEVRDHGIGMTLEQQGRCFDRFWQADGASTRRFAGTGLGLHVVRSLVTAMGATLTLDSAPGQGSSFGVCLRRSDRTAPTAVAPARTTGERTTVEEFLRQAGLRETAP